MFCAVRNAVLAAVALLFWVSAANASPITYNFTATATSGPLSGTVEHGTFSYDSSSIIPGGINAAAGLLTSLSFSWNGISYDQTTANTGDLHFDAAGHLTQALFGTDCSAAGNCQLVDGDNSWFGITGGFFTYSVPDGLGGGSLTAVLAVSTPEPTTLALLGLGSVLVGTLRHRGARACPRLAWCGRPASAATSPP
jgi:hypothetical protein